MVAGPKAVGREKAGGSQKILAGGEQNNARYLAGYVKFYPKAERMWM